MSPSNIAPQKSWLEWSIYAALTLLFSALVLLEGAHAARLNEQTPLAPKALYERLKKSNVKLQIVDVREDADEYEDMHLPGAIPFPACDLGKTPEGARERILASAPTIVVSAEGDAATFAKCAAFFTAARNLEGGMTAWDDENLPEDSGEYVPPKASAGGGCL